jgi:hypothetical protein
VPWKFKEGAHNPARVRQQARRMFSKKAILELEVKGQVGVFHVKWTEKWSIVDRGKSMCTDWIQNKDNYLERPEIFQLLENRMQERKGKIWGGELN